MKKNVKIEYCFDIENWQIYVLTALMFVGGPELCYYILFSRFQILLYMGNNQCTVFNENEVLPY